MFLITLLAALDSDAAMRVSDFTQKQLEYAANVSFAAYSLTFLFIAVLAILGIHFFWIAYPNAKSQRECNEKTVVSVQMFAASSAANSQILDDLKDLSIAHASRLSKWEQEQAKNRCPMRDSWPNGVPPNLLPPKPNLGTSGQ